MENQTNTYHKYCPNVFLETATEYHEGLKSGKYPREHSYSMPYAKKAVNEAQKNLDLAIKLLGE